MNRVRWLGLCRWVHLLLVIFYVFVTIMLVIVLLMLFGVHMANGLRWALLVGWFAVCFGGVLVVEWVGLSPGQGCRLPIRSEEERLSGLIDDVWRKTGSIEKGVRFLIRSDEKKRDGSFGRRTIIISSGTLMLASDEELNGILAHELGHLHDGDRIMEAAFYCSGLIARTFRLAWHFIRRGLRSNAVSGFMLLIFLSPVLLPLLLFFLVYLVFQRLIWLLSALGDYRQDCFTVRSGCGKGLRDWLEKSGLAANADRIRRLEKML